MEQSDFERIRKNYWNYYRELEREFLETRKYVEVTKRNFSTYSLEYLKIFVATCSEIDVVGKAMAKFLYPTFDYKNSSISKWWYLIQDKYALKETYNSEHKTKEELRSFTLQEYSCGDIDGLELRPWKNYHLDKSMSKKRKEIIKLSQGCKTPSWWKEYNSVKHERIKLLERNESSNFPKANLMNVLWALSALYVLEKAFMDSVGTEQDLARFNDFSDLFTGRIMLTLSQLEFVDKHI